MNHEEIKKQLLQRIDDIVVAIRDDKVVEIRKEKDNVQIFEAKRKKLNILKK